jgi:hypothetical protein
VEQQALELGHWVAPEQDPPPEQVISQPQDRLQSMPARQLSLPVQAILQ